MKIKTLYVRFYKSFNYDYLRKSDPRAVPDPWDVLEDGRVYPFVSVGLEDGVTTVVGANESGKSQLISATKCLLTGQKIERSDFCRYSEFFAVDKAMALPEFGGEFNDLTEGDVGTVREVLGLDDGVAVPAFCLFRFEGRVVAYWPGSGGWEPVELHDAAVKRLGLPTFFEVDPDIPLPDSVPLDYLVAPDSYTDLRPRRDLVRLTSGLREKFSLFSSAESITKGAATIFDAIGAETEVRESDRHLGEQLELAEKLLIQVAGIDRTAFEQLREAALESEGYANGIVDRMNQQLADALNFKRWWTQDSKFSLYLTLRDHDLVFTVRDRTGSDYSFSERSGGMKYFLSYFVQFRSHEPSGGQEILLMDEPDAFLSSTGQQDLLRIFEDFAYPENPEQRPVQVMYVTHSPFLIDKNHGERVRVLEKGDGEEGTRVVGNAAHNHYEPLRSAFGAFVAETTFIGNCNLMVEGQADQVLLAGVSSLSRRLRRNTENLDLNTLSLVPAGGAPHVPYLVYLALGRDVDRPAVVVLLDSDPEADAAAAELRAGYRDKALIDKDLILQVGDADVTGLSIATSAVQEIEDLLTANVAYAAIKHLAAEVLFEADAKKITDALPKIEPTPGQKLYDATRAAVSAAAKDSGVRLWLDKIGFARSVLHVLANGGVSTKERDTVLKNFESLFGLLNEAQRKALRRSDTERVSTIVTRLRKNFLKDHKNAASRRDARAFLEEVATKIPESGVESDRLLDDIRRIQAEHHLDDAPLTQIDDYAKFRVDLESLAYAAVREVQVA